MNQELFNYLSDNFRITPLQTDMQEIESIVKKSLLIPVDKDNLPTCEVVGFADDKEVLRGYIVNDLESGIVCTNYEMYLAGVTHYMEIPKLK